MEDRVNQQSEALSRAVTRLCKDGRYSGQIEALGPASAPLSRLKRKYRCQMLLKGKKWNLLHELTERVVEIMERKHSLPGVKLVVDVDPINML